MAIIRIKKTKFYTTIAVAAVAAIIVVIYCFRYVIEGWLMSAPKLAEQEISSYNILRAGGRDVAAFRHISSDSLLLGLSDNNSQTVGFADGRDTLWRNMDLHTAVIKTQEYYRQKLRTFDAMDKELDYFISRSSIQDEGYDIAARYVRNIDSLRQRCRGILDKLQGIAPGESLSVGHIATVAPNANTADSALFVESMGGVWRAGRWYNAVRSGRGIGMDGNHRWLCGMWSGDTIIKGRRVDSLGTYSGQFSRELLAGGHGIYHSHDGVFYQGQFADDEIDGFCVAIDDEKLRIGEWVAGRYRGQKLNFTTERIYGIDISRYQHGKGRKYIPIHWKKLRIRSLGNISKKRITGDVDYPVSFVYIKSTEGVSVHNRYYLADSRAARANGFKCGAYHFFSTKSSGTAQAGYFLRNSVFKRGDLPPVLDVEPTHKQIVQMGGVEAMFASVRSWLRIVQQHTGVRPVLYVNQTFVNKYLGQAPDIKNDYNIWIARYGEYKPDVHLVFWQLCPDGHVQGITGDVDINVFNGYSQQFRQFLSTDCIK